MMIIKEQKHYNNGHWWYCRSVLLLKIIWIHWHKGQNGIEKNVPDFRLRSIHIFNWLVPFVKYYSV